MTVYVEAGSKNSNKLQNLIFEYYLKLLGLFELDMSIFIAAIFFKNFKKSEK